MMSSAVAIRPGEPIDWPEGFTLGPPVLFARVAAALTTGPVRPVIIVQKVSAEWLSRGFLPLLFRPAIVGAAVREEATSA